MQCTMNGLAGWTSLDMHCTGAKHELVFPGTRNIGHTSGPVFPEHGEPKRSQESWS